MVSTILASSTIIYFSLALFNSLTLKLLLSISHFRNLWIVYAGIKTDSDILLAALPVGDSNAISSSSTFKISFKILTIHFIIVVLPVPGPPVITVKLLVTAFIMASFWVSS